MKKLRRPTEKQCLKAHAAVSRLIDETVKVAHLDRSDVKRDPNELHVNWVIATTVGRAKVSICSAGQHFTHFNVFTDLCFERSDRAALNVSGVDDGYLKLYAGPINDPTVTPEIAVERWKQLLAPAVPAFRIQYGTGGVIDTQVWSAKHDFESACRCKLLADEVLRTNPRGLSYPSLVQSANGVAATDTSQRAYVANNLWGAGFSRERVAAELDLIDDLATGRRTRLPIDPSVLYRRVARKSAR